MRNNILVVHIYAYVHKHIKWTLHNKNDTKHMEKKGEIPDKYIIK